MSIVNYISIDYGVSPRLIIIDTTLSTSISVQDLIDTCSDIGASSSSIDDAILLESSGKEYLTADGSVKVGLTVTLNNCRIKFTSPGSAPWILCSIEGGNVVAVEDIYTSPRVYIDVVEPSEYVTVERVSSSSATLSEISAIQYSSFDGAVTIDILNGVAGTTYNIGTLENPVNNIPDAISIANTRGFEKFHVHGDLTLTTGHDVDGFEFIGHSPSKTTIEILDAASTVGCEFKDCTVSGILDGNAILEKCVVGDLNYIEGRIEGCTLIGVIVLSGSEPTRIYNCFDGTPGYDNNPVIDCGGSGRGLSVGAYTGGIDIKNKTGPETLDLNLVTGRIILQDTVTSGTIYCRGIGQVVDNSTGDAVVVNEALYITDIKTLLTSIKDATLVKQSVVDDVSATTTKFTTTLTETTNGFWDRASILFTSGNNDGQIRGIKNYTGSTKEVEIETPLPFILSDGDNFSIIADRKYLSPEAYGGTIYYDAVAGVSGTNYPVGIHEYPVNNVDDLLTIVAARKIDQIDLHNSITFSAGQNIDNMCVKTCGVMGTTVTLESGCSANNSSFRYVNLQGIVTNGDTLLVENCSIYNLENFTGIMQGVSFAQGSEISVGTWAEIYNCRAGGEPGNEPEISINGATLNIQQYRGNLKFTNKTGDNRTVAGFLPGNVTIADTCVSGTIQILGIGEVEKDESGPNCKVDVDAAITNEYIADHILDELVSEHSDVAGSLASEIKKIKNKVGFIGVNI